MKMSAVAVAICLLLAVAGTHAAGRELRQVEGAGAATPEAAASAVVGGAEGAPSLHPRPGVSARVPFGLTDGDNAAAGASGAAEAAGEFAGAVPAPEKTVALTRRQYTRTGPAASAQFARQIKPGGGGASGGGCPYSPYGGCNDATKVTYNNPYPIMGRAAPLLVIPLYYGTWSAAQITIVNNYLAGLGNSTWMGITAEYSDTVGYFNNGVSMFNPAKQYNFNGVDTSLSGSNGGVSLTDSNVLTLVSRGVTATGGLNPNAIYLLLTGPNIAQGSSRSSFCKNYCGWHTYATSSSGVQIKYAFIGNAITKCPTGCISGALSSNAVSPNNDRGIDGMISVIAHEITEAASDPTLNVWWDRQTGYENADVCAWQFGTASRTADNRAYNTVDSLGRKYLVQLNYSVKRAGCYVARM